MKKYRAAIIGCGRIGSGFDKRPPKKTAFSHAGAYAIHPKTILVTASDSKKAKRDEFKRKWGLEAVYSDYKEMLKEEKIDILSICTTAESHLEIIKYASKFPLKAIYCEKPIADSVKAAERMVGLCRKNKIILTVNHQRRFGPFYRELKKKIGRGLIGKAQHVNCYYTRGIMNTGIHILDLFCFLFGRVGWVQAAYSLNKSPFAEDPNLDGVIKFKNGLSITISGCSDSHYLILEIDILTDKARIRFGNSFEYFKACPGRNLLGIKELVKVKNAPFQSTDTGVSLRYGVDHIINCLKKREKPLSSGEDATYALRVVEKMLDSAKNGKREYIDSKI